jgi:hypothetical protein
MHQRPGLRLRHFLRENPDPPLPPRRRDRKDRQSPWRFQSPPSPWKTRSVLCRRNLEGWGSWFAPTGDAKYTVGFEILRAVARLQCDPLTGVAISLGKTARFQREAQVLASLNQANIATIYGLETSGASDRSSWNWSKDQRSRRASVVLRRTPPSRAPTLKLAPFNSLRSLSITRRSSQSPQSGMNGEGV